MSLIRNMIFDIVVVLGLRNCAGESIACSMPLGAEA